MAKNNIATPPQENSETRRAFLANRPAQLLALLASGHFSNLVWGSIDDGAAASELKENSDWHKGIESLLIDVFKSEVETTGTFVELKNGEVLWVDIKDQETIINHIKPKVNTASTYPKEIADSIEAKGIDFSQIKKIIPMHTHPFSALLKLKPEYRKKVQAIKKTGKIEDFHLPPSMNDLDNQAGLTAWRREKHRNEVWKAKRLEPEILKNGLVEPSGVWLWNRINVEQLPKNSELRTYLENKETTKKDWGNLLQGKLLEKIERTSTEEMKNLLVKYAGKEIRAFVQKNNLERGPIVRHFENALNYNREIIEEFIEEKADLELALAHLEISQKDHNVQVLHNKIDARTKQGTVQDADIQNFIDALAWMQIEMTFTPHSEELIQKVLDRVNHQ